MLTPQWDLPPDACIEKISSKVMLHMQKTLWCTATTQPSILSELLCILGAEGCVVDVDLRGPMRSVTKAKYPELLADFPSKFKVAS